MDLTQILFTVLILVLGAVGTFFWYIIKDLKKRIELLESEMKEVKTNYLNRFEGVKDHISTENKAIVQAINDLKIEIAKK